MKTFNILLKEINDVKNFVNIMCRFDTEMDLSSGRYIVDAKSIMGIFSLDLTKPIKAEIVADNGDAEALVKELAPYIVD
ncbi:MAG: HPr family phosphocarrier protein [Ruminococcaceae bacterium]|nr:HPr family phosphocarrier protein [Oscillospiraceae bacterium]